MLDNRHLVLRGDTASSVMKVRSALEWAVAMAYEEMKLTKISPSALVQTQVEGGATLFSLPYYDETAFLTQSSQLYLEIAIQNLGNVSCLEKSFRAEKCLTRRYIKSKSMYDKKLTFSDICPNTLILK